MLTREIDTFVLCSMIPRDYSDNLTNSNNILYYFNEYKRSNQRVYIYIIFINYLTYCIQYVYCMNVPWKINTWIGGAIGLSLASGTLSYWYELRSGGNWGHAPQEEYFITVDCKLARLTNQQTNLKVSRRD